ncbi:MAG: PTS sugar transporter subunit IIA [Peptococcaceae bacterium]|jgi:PTS system galactitol-specific IIA component|nr:PTS sugar transporter subunit IIA [Peptococcaceae bacterium]
MTKTVYQELIVPELDAGDAGDAIRQFGARFLAGGFVRDTFVAAVLEREEKYPTGLQLDGMALAMPHTSGEHVRRPAVGVAKLKKPVIFGHMGDEETKVEAEMLLMMAIQDPDAQVDLLRKVMGVFTNQEALAEFKAAGDFEALYAAATKYLG